MKLNKEKVQKFLKKLNNEINKTFQQMKNNFEMNPPTNNQIRKKFMQWKGKYDYIVIQSLKEIQENQDRNFDFKQFIVKITEQYSNDQQFLELLKLVNNSIENLKDFIRINLIKDPSIYEIKQ